jgi:uncharacterized coiled-coil DUF342 family protein
MIMLDLLAEIGKLRTEKADLQTEIKHLISHVRSVESQRDEWKDRWQAEHDDHQRTIEHFDKVMNDDHH